MRRTQKVAFLPSSYLISRIIPHSGHSLYVETLLLAAKTSQSHAFPPCLLLSALLLYLTSKSWSFSGLSLGTSFLLQLYFLLGIKIYIHNFKFHLLYCWMLSFYPKSSYSLNFSQYLFIYLPICLCLSLVHLSYQTDISLGCLMGTSKSKVWIAYVVIFSTFGRYHLSNWLHPILQVRVTIVIHDPSFSLSLHKQLISFIF